MLVTRQGVSLKLQQRAGAQTFFTTRRPSLAVRAVEEAPSSSPESSSGGPASQPGKPTFVREFTSLGSKVIEQDAAFEEPPATDMFEGEKFEAFGQFLERWFLPFLVVLGLVCGGYAASSYNSDADLLIQPATGPDEPVKVIPASALEAALTGAPTPAPAPAAE